MVNKILILTLFIVGCGKEPKFNASNLESFSQITAPTAASLNQQGTLNKISATNAVLIANGQNLTISKYSSYAALEFIAARPVGQISVKFKGEARSGEVVLEGIQGL